MDWELFTSIVDQAPGLARAVLHGVGEPMLVANLPRMVRYRCITMPGTPAWKSRTITSFSGTCRRTRRSCNSMPCRRRVLAGAGGLLLVVAPVLRRAPAAGLVEVRMRSDPDGAQVGFDPIGLKVAPGTTVRWVVEANVHTTTAYHPANGGHPLRIPERAAPWNRTIWWTRPGLRSHAVSRGRLRLFLPAARGGRIVGRIVVGRPGGPGASPPARRCRWLHERRSRAWSGSWPRGQSDPLRNMRMPPAEDLQAAFGCGWASTVLPSRAPRKRSRQ